VYVQAYKTKPQAAFSAGVRQLTAATTGDEVSPNTSPQRLWPQDAKSVMPRRMVRRE